MLFNVTSNTNDHYSLYITYQWTGSNEVNLPNWKCVLRTCIDCPKYKIPTVESNETFDSPIIKFHIYEVFTICSKHDTIGSGNVCDLCSQSVHIGKKPVKLSRRNILTLRCKVKNNNGTVCDSPIDGGSNACKCMMCNGECGHYYCGYCFKEIGTEVNVAHAHVMECGGSYYGRGGDNALGIQNQAVTDQEHEIAVKKAKERNILQKNVNASPRCVTAWIARRQGINCGHIVAQGANWSDSIKSITTMIEMYIFRGVVDEEQEILIKIFILGFCNVDSAVVAILEFL